MLTSKDSKWTSNINDWIDNNQHQLLRNKESKRIRRIKKNKKKQRVTISIWHLDFTTSCIAAARRGLQDQPHHHWDAHCTQQRTQHMQSKSNSACWVVNTRTQKAEALPQAGSSIKAMNEKEKTRTHCTEELQEHNKNALKKTRAQQEC